jgi:hypothetical protein
MNKTPKEKAKELFDQYYLIIFNVGGELAEEILISILAKDCAIFAALKIQENPVNYKTRLFWDEVIKEIDYL